MNKNQLSTRDARMLNRALNVAKASTCKNKHGAVITRGGSVLSVGINTTRNFCYNISTPKTDSSVHAEIAALRACGNPKGATIFVARVNRQGLARLSRPCSACMEALLAAGIKTVIYTT